MAGTDRLQFLWPAAPRHLAVPGYRSGRHEEILLPLCEDDHGVGVLQYHDAVLVVASHLL